MSKRSRLKKYQVFSNHDSTTNQTSNHSTVDLLDEIAYVFKVDLTVEGTIEVQFCDDENLSNSSAWQSLDFGGTYGKDLPIDGAVDVDYRIQIKGTFKHLRTNWTNGAGTGNLNAYITGTTIGA